MKYFPKKIEIKKRKKTRVRVKIIVKRKILKGELKYTLIDMLGIFILLKAK